MKKLVSIVFSLVLLVFALFTSNIVLFASEDKIISGSFTDNSAYSFDKTNGELTIDGYGMIWTGRILSEDLYSESVKIEDIKKLIIKDGITIFNISIFFSPYDENIKLTEITLPKSIKKVEGSFDNCSDLKTINYAGSKNEWDKIIFSENQKEELSEMHFNYSVDVPKSTTGISGKGNEIRTEKLNERINLPNENISCTYNFITEDLEINGKGELKTDNENRLLRSLMFTAGDPYDIDYVRLVTFKNVVINEGITKLCESNFEYEKINSIAIPVSVKEIEKNCFGGLIDEEKTNLEVYYAGSKEDWEKILIGENNEMLTKGNIHYENKVSAEHENNSNSQKTGIYIAIISVAAVLIIAAGVIFVIKKKKNKQ